MINVIFLVAVSIFALHKIYVYGFSGKTFEATIVALLYSAVAFLNSGNHFILVILLLICIAIWSAVFASIFIERVNLDREQLYR